MTSSPNATQELAVEASNISQVTLEGVPVPNDSCEIVTKVFAFQNDENPELVNNIGRCIIYQSIPKNDEMWPLRTEFITSYYQCENEGTQCPPCCPSQNHRWDSGNRRQNISIQQVGAPGVPPTRVSTVSGVTGASVDVGNDVRGNGSIAVSTYETGVGQSSRPASITVQAGNIASKSAYKGNQTQLCNCSPVTNDCTPCKNMNGPSNIRDYHLGGTMQDACTCCPSAPTRHFTQQTYDRMVDDYNEGPINVSVDIGVPTINRFGIYNTTTRLAPPYAEASCQCDSDDDINPNKLIDTQDTECQCSFHLYALEHSHEAQPPQTLQNTGTNQGQKRGSMKQVFKDEESNQSIPTTNDAQHQTVPRNVQVQRSSNQPSIPSQQTNEPKKLCLCKQPNAIVCVPESAMPGNDVVHDGHGNKIRTERICKCCTNDNTTDGGNKSRGLDGRDDPQCSCHLSTLQLDNNWKHNVTNFVYSVTSWPRGYLKGGNKPECQCTNATCKETCTRYSKTAEDKSPCVCSNEKCKRRELPEVVAVILAIPSEKSSANSKARTPISTTGSNKPPSEAASAKGEETVKSTHNYESTHKCFCNNDIECHTYCQKIKEETRRKQALGEEPLIKSPAQSTHSTNHSVSQKSHHTTSSDKDPTNAVGTTATSSNHDTEHEQCGCSKPDCPKKTTNVAKKLATRVIIDSGQSLAKNNHSNKLSNKQSPANLPTTVNLPPTTNLLPTDVDPCYCPKSGCAPGCHDPKMQGENFTGCANTNEDTDSNYILNSIKEITDNISHQTSVKDTDVSKQASQVASSDKESHVEDSEKISQVASSGTASHVESSGKPSQIASDKTVPKKSSCICPPDDCTITEQVVTDKTTSEKSSKENYSESQSQRIVEISNIQNQDGDADNTIVNANQSKLQSTASSPAKTPVSASTRSTLPVGAKNDCICPSNTCDNMNENARPPPAAGLPPTTASIKNSITESAAGSPTKTPENASIRSSPQEAQSEYPTDAGEDVNAITAPPPTDITSASLKNATIESAAGSPAKTAVNASIQSIPQEASNDDNPENAGEDVNEVTEPPPTDNISTSLKNAVTESAAISPAKTPEVSSIRSGPSQGDKSVASIINSKTESAAGSPAKTPVNESIERIPTIVANSDYLTKTAEDVNEITGPPPTAKPIEKAIAILVDENGQPMYVDGKGMQVVAYSSDGTPIVLPQGLNIDKMRGVKSAEKSVQSDKSYRRDQETSFDRGEEGKGPTDDIIGSQKATNPDSPSYVTNITNTEMLERKPQTVVDINDAAKCVCTGPTNERCEMVRYQRKNMVNQRKNSRSSIVSTNIKPKDTYTQIERNPNTGKCVCCPHKYQRNAKN